MPEDTKKEVETFLAKIELCPKADPNAPETEDQKLERINKVFELFDTEGGAVRGRASLNEKEMKCLIRANDASLQSAEEDVVDAALTELLKGSWDKKDRECDVNELRMIFKERDFNIMPKNIVAGLNLIELCPKADPNAPETEDQKLDRIDAVFKAFNTEGGKVRGKESLNENEMKALIKANDPTCVDLDTALTELLKDSWEAKVEEKSGGNKKADRECDQNELRMIFKTRPLNIRLKQS